LSFGDEREFIASDQGSQAPGTAPSTEHPRLNDRRAVPTAFSHRVEPKTGENLFNFAHFLEKKLKVFAAHIS
jgi:hypothetical protein